MPYPHSIRLRGPWQFEPLCRYVADGDGRVVESREGLPPAGRTTVPGDWSDTLGCDFRGRVRYRRSFNPPARLDPHERLWLVIEGVDARGVVGINGVRLGEVDGYAIHSCFEITRLLAAHNQLTLDVELPCESVTGNTPLRPGRELLAGGPVGEVRLEVRSQWFIDGLAIWSAMPPERRFVVSGRIAGEPTTTSLAVVVNGCQRELAYFEIGYGDGFEVVIDAEDFPVWTPHRPALAPLEVKLLGGSSSAWQTQIDTAYREAVVADARQVVEAIPPDAAYTDLDRRGTTIVQRIPPAWSSEVCRRLAHHPSIVAWSAGPGETPPEGMLCGRIWV
jgi:hypothetical protein